MKPRSKAGKIAKALYSYFLFFSLTAFLITCCMMLFISVMQESMGISLEGEHIKTAARLTFVNVLILSGIFTLIDAIRRKFTVERPVRQISEAAKRISQGDFSVRIKKGASGMGGEAFDEVIDCFNMITGELSGVESLRSDFISNVSHEFKTPLAVIQNYVTLLDDPCLDEEKRQEYLKGISVATVNLSGLVTNILKLNKLESQQICPNMSVYNLSEQLCECLLGFESAWERKGLEIDVDIEDDIFINTDSEMMTLVWNNLFSNAVKFTDAGGKVSLSLKKDGEFARVRISDTGCGISSEVGENIFKKFYQADNSRSTSGNGLGLTLVKRVIDITGSEISVSSRVGEGSTFTVRIRMADNGEI